MKNKDVINSASEKIKAGKARSRWHKAMSAAACVVVFCTVYSLILPAIALEASAESLYEGCTLYCTTAEHTHTDECADKTLICQVEDVPVHTHGEDCYRTLICEKSFQNAHRHTEDCYTTERELSCKLAETEGHTHTDECNAVENQSVCTEPTEPPDHLHTDSCYTDKQVLKCQLSETDTTHLEHSENCYEYSENPLCGKEEADPSTHGHTDKCYETTITCEEAEHMHSLICYTPPEILADSGGSGEDFDPVAGTQELIDMLPQYSEFENKLLEYENSGDWAEYEQYLLKTIQDASGAYIMYMDLEKDQQALLIGVENMLELHRIELPVPLALQTSWPVFAVNMGWTNSIQSTVIVLDDAYTVGNLSSFSSLTNYRDWTIIEVTSKGIVTQIIGHGKKDSSLKPSAGSYFIIWHGDMTKFGASSTISCAVGDSVALSGINLSEQKRGSTSSASIGTITITSGTAPSDPVKFTYDIPTLDSVDMADKITVNLFDYSDLVNSEWYSKDTCYPGFQNPGGTKNTSTTLSLTNKGHYNFGDIITADTGISDVAGKDYSNKINKLNEQANKALNGDDYRVMLPSLNSNNMPAFADGDTYNLDYLFTHNPNKGVTQMNDKNITGLFRIDTDTDSETYGNYYFDSRKNFAEFDAETDKFTLYDAFFTPNYLMYPFGNFMPLNRIETTTTKVADINKDGNDRLRQIAGYAAKLAESTSGTAADNYTALAINLSRMNQLLDERNPNWSGLDGADYYFSQLNASERPDYYGDETKKASLENRLYNLDYDEESNFFFGMSIDFNFIQPKDGMYKSEYIQDANLAAMKFNFAGDDDVWVYIDGILLLDISGIHRHVGGTIDFKTGTVTYYPFENWDGKVSDTPYLTETFAQIFTRAGYTTAQLDEILIKDGNGDYTTFKNYTNHTFKMYYMERGSGSSVCSINFNMPVIKDNTIGVMKQVQTTDGDTSYLGNPWYKFQILKADANGNKTNQLLITEGTEFEVFDLYGQFLRTDTAGENGIFHIKADEIAEFPVPENAGKYYVRELVQENISDQIKFVRVDGIEQTTDNTNGIHTLSGFEGYDSNIKDISDGTTIFTYINTYDADRFGGLAITKTVDGATDGFSETFTFNITLDDESLPDDTEYTLYDKNGREIGEDSVGADSTVAIGHNQTAVITGIAAGSIFKVQETGATEYSVTYSGDDIAVVGGYATGTILPAPAGQTNISTVQLNATNYVSDEEIRIPVSKVLNNFDGTDRTFKFKLEQVDNTGRLISGTTNIFHSADNPAADTAKYTEISPSASAGETTAKGTGQFIIPLGFESLVAKGYSLPTTLYFKVTEIDEGAALVGYDNTSYIVAVPLSIKSGQLTAGDMTITGGDSIVFTNTLLDSLKISKVVIDGSSDSEFTFTLKVADGNFSDILVYEKGTTKGTLYADNTTNLYTFTLKDREEITISNLPVGAEYRVAETGYDGFYPSYRINSTDGYTAGNTAEGTLTWIVDNAQFTDHVEFENRAGSQLPHTGGAGTTLYTSGGVLLMGASLILGYVIKRRKNSNI